jgi:hypothetical protein
MFFFSPSTRGFYNDESNTNIPEDAVPIKEALHRELLIGQANGGRIEFDKKSNLPVLVTTVSDDAILQSYKAYAGAMLAKTDWTMMPDVKLVNKKEFAEYRAAMRKLRIEPELEPVWPTMPKPIWG